MPSQMNEALVLADKGYSDWIDRELVSHVAAYKVIGEQDLNSLLELRELMVHHREMDSAQVIRDFFRLRNGLEKNFYLLCYRLRNWLNVFYELEVSDPLGYEQLTLMPLDLRFRDFGQLLNAARHRYFEFAKSTVSFPDIRVKVLRRQEDK